MIAGEADGVGKAWSVLAEARHVCIGLNAGKEGDWLYGMSLSLLIIPERDPFSPSSSLRLPLLLSFLPSSNTWSCSPPLSPFS